MVAIFIGGSVVVDRMYQAFPYPGYTLCRHLAGRDIIAADTGVATGVA
jgi:hypothetical protein